MEAPHTHSPEGPEQCFGCKLAYMRSSGGFAVTTPTVRQGVRWWDTTMAEEVRKAKAEHGPDAVQKPARAELI